MNRPLITAADVQDMATHWLGTPVNGYLGSGYGSEVKALLQQPMATEQADAVVRKLREDVPLIAALGDESVAVFIEDVGMDRKRLVLDVAGVQIDLNEAGGGDE
jgi:hypothetical protein